MADLGTMIRPGYWDLGLGSKMLRIIMDQAREAGIEILFLIVFSSNLRAIHVYEKMGFKETGRIPRGVLMDGVYFDKIMMTKELA